MRFLPCIFWQLIIIFILSGTSLTGQSNYADGYILLSDGQRIEGQIHNRDWPFAIPNISFRPNPEASDTKYGPEDLKGFGFDDEVYISRKVRVITNSRKTKSLEKDTTLNWNEETVFLRKYIGGTVGLYRYVDNNKKRHFFLEKKGKFIYLIYERHLRLDKEIKVVKTLDRYKTQMVQQLSDCEDFVGTISDTRYKLDQLYEAILTWYTCTGYTPQYTNGLNNGRIYLSPIFGLSRSTILTPLPSSLGELSLEHAYSPVLGLGLEYTFPTWQERISARLDVFYHSFSGASRTRRFTEGNVETKNVRLQSQNTILFNLLARGKLSGNKAFRPFLEAGVALGLVQKFNHQSLQYRTIGDGEERLITKLEIDRTSRTALGLVGGAGLSINKLNIGLRAHYTKREPLLIEISTLRVFAQIEYQFGIRSL